ncbi:MAG TPA: hypothetical protein VMV27_12435 [Candidatus Binataceae bacterium]|nr:hypothetical protein [Candidatus Binataceae bacterium]
MSDDYDEFDDGQRRSTDSEEGYVDAAKAEILKLIGERPEDVFYERQFQVFFEKRFFHWITARAVDELAQDAVIESEFVPLPAGGPARFFFSKQLRYWRRKAQESVKLIGRYSSHVFTQAVGHHAELLFDAALARAGFLPVATETREFNGRRWEESAHDLDRIYNRDGFFYGTEIKNKLAYIDAQEFAIKLRMCGFLGVRPLFIARWMPKSYVWEVVKAGGFCLLFKFQLFPFGNEQFAKELRDKLGLPTDCPRGIEEGTVRRLLDWHLKSFKAP